MANLLPNTLNLTGTDLTGSDATANRTYTINDSDILSAGLGIVVNQSSLMSGDFSFASPIITFLNIIDNVDNIRITYFTQASGSGGSLSYSSTQSLTSFMGLLGTVPNRDAKEKEKMGVGDGSTTDYWFANLGVLDDTYTIYYGSAETTTTTLTETTHYTIDLDSCKISLTASGKTLANGSNIYGVYKKNNAGILDSDMVLALQAAENRVKRDTELIFADYTVANPSYVQITNELKKGHYDPVQKVYDLNYPPIVKVQTTVNGAYTTGGTSIVLDSATGLPNSGTIYIGGNKVAYTAKSTNTLTVPSTTPSIADAAVVRGEVIELSIEPEGSSPSYTVLTPDTDYEIDYDLGRVKVLNNAYWGEISSDDRIYPSNYLVRMNYMSAWHDPGQNPEIPDEIEWVVNAIAARRLMGSVVSKAHSMGLDQFNPALINVDFEEIKAVLEKYKILNVGTAMYNKQGWS